ncbi:MAG: metallophosphoesterase [Candidatus Aenigmarchaeota archaeon]|nr:metallophosphoesterase [Candidatus Aenigmarchaeota archaeon]
MKILLLGDVHEDINKVKKIIDSVECDFVLQVGDLGIYSNFSKPMYFIAGNHENWDIIEAMNNGTIEFENLRRIKTAEIIPLKKGNDIIRVSGLNGNYSQKDYGLKKKELEGRRRSHFVKDDVERCKKLRNIDIFLSHEAPAGIGFVKRNKDVGIDHVKEILDNVKPRFFFFGHHHVFFEKIIGTTQVFGLNYARREYYILDTNEDKVRRILMDGDFNARI